MESKRLPHVLSPQSAKFLFNLHVLMLASLVSVGCYSVVVDDRPGTVPTAPVSVVPVHEVSVVPVHEVPVPVHDVPHEVVVHDRHQPATTASVSGETAHRVTPNQDELNTGSEVSSSRNSGHTKSLDDIDDPVAELSSHGGSAQEAYLSTPYPVPVIKEQAGLRATASEHVKQCPGGTLRYCDHRKNRCSCVSAATTVRSMQPVSLGF